MSFLTHSQWSMILRQSVKTFIGNSNNRGLRFNINRSVGWEKEKEREKKKLT